jgi:hypothetical protein
MSSQSVILEADGLPPIVPLEEMLKTPLTEEQQKAAHAVFEEEEAETDDFDYEGWSNYTNQVVRNWNEEDRKWVAYGKHIGAKIEECKNNFKDIKDKEERFKRKKQNWSEYFRIAEAIDGNLPRISPAAEYRNKAKEKPRRKAVIEGVLKNTV